MEEALKAFEQEKLAVSAAEEQRRKQEMQEMLRLLGVYQLSFPFDPKRKKI